MISPYVGVDPVQQRIDAGANWFYWVAGLSLINTLTAQSESSFNFVLGLGITQVLDALAAGSPLKGMALGIDLFVILTCALVGQYARDSRTVYIAGMIAYALDSMIFVLAQDIVGIGFHAFVLFSMFKGVKAFSELTERTRASVTRTTAAEGPTPTTS